MARTSNTDIFRIEGDVPGVGFGQSAEIERRLLDMNGYTTVNVTNIGPDTLTVKPITVTAVNDPKRGYTLGAGSTLTAGQNANITGYSKLASAGVSTVQVTYTP